MSEYRYIMFFAGANYADFDVESARDAIAVESIQHARDTLREMSDGRSWAERGDGRRMQDTPAFGEPGDYAYLFPVPLEDPGYAPVLDLDGDRARHAYSWALSEMTQGGIIQDLSPAYVLTFGPRGGIAICAQ